MKRFNKKTLPRLWRELAGLWRDYDPIGIMDDPKAPRDEYDTYVGQTLRRLIEGASPAEIAAHLEELSARMGLPFDRARAEEHANRMVDWYRNATANRDG